MNNEDFLKIGDRVRPNHSLLYKPAGTIVDKQPPTTMNGVVLVGPKYKVKWEDGGESGWLSCFDIILIECGG